MLKISNLNVSLSENKKKILHNVNLEVNPGEVHLLNGRNGSGKSTLVNTIMGHPGFEVTSGKIELLNESYTPEIIEKIDEDALVKNNGSVNVDITMLNANERSLCGIYLASQYPVEIPGVSLMSFLRLVFNSRRKKEDQLNVYRFKNYIEEKAEMIGYPKSLLKRNLNEGFSGGEKKKTEILQMLILEPKFVLLDEIDSGLDRTSVKDVFEGLSAFKKHNSASSFIIITHYDRASEYLNIDFSHEMVDGSLLV